MRRAATWAALALPGAGMLAGQDGDGDALSIRFDGNPGVAYRMDETTVSTFLRTDGKVVPGERGGTFHYVYDARIDKRFEGGTSMAVVSSLRGNGAYWTMQDELVLWDTEEDPQSLPADEKWHASRFLRNAKRVTTVAIDERARVLDVWEGWRDPPSWMRRWDSLIVGDVQRLFLPLPPRPVRPGSTHRGWLRVDMDPVSSGWFVNDVPYPIGVRFEGVWGERARFSVRGGATRRRVCRYYMNGLRRQMDWKWINRVEVEGIVDVDVATGWIVSRDQTTTIVFDKISTDEHGRNNVVEVENTRHLIVEAERTS